MIGDTSRQEFQPALRATGSLCEMVEVPTPEEAIAQIEAGAMPDWIVLVESVPGQISHSAVELLMHASPLSRIVGLLGSLCEGSARTGKPWPGVQRVYWHQWPVQFKRQVELLAEGKLTSWSLPPTAGDDDHFLLEGKYAYRQGRGLVAIYSHRAQMDEWLSLTCRSTGRSSVWLDPYRPTRVAGAVAILFDGSDASEAECDRLAAIADLYPGTPILGMLDFPRIEDHDRFLSAGASVVLSKPLLPEDLTRQLADWDAT